MASPGWVPHRSGRCANVAMYAGRPRVQPEEATMGLPCASWRGPGLVQSV